MAQRKSVGDRDAQRRHDDRDATLKQDARHRRGGAPHRPAVITGPRFEGAQARMMA
jgi:hypothetical protein